MKQALPILFKCHLDALSPCGSDDVTNDDLCAFEFPWCEGCPKAWNPKRLRKDDPLKAAVWAAWIKGVRSPG